MSNVELDSPAAAMVVTFSAVDGVGRVRLESGEELRFGASAWKEGGPSVGAAVFVTAVGPHPLGGRRAVALRLRPVSEAAVRAEAAAMEEAKARAAEQERDVRRAVAVKTTTHEAIVARVRAAAPPEYEDEDRQLLAGIVADPRSCASRSRRFSSPAPRPGASRKIRRAEPQRTQPPTTKLMVKAVVFTSPVRSTSSAGARPRK